MRACHWYCAVTLELYDADRSMGKPLWTQWCEKEFIYSMQAKGLMVAHPGEAQQRKESEHETTSRVFPAGNIEDWAATRVMAGLHGTASPPRIQQITATLPINQQPTTRRSKQQRAELVSNLKHLKAQLAHEKQQTQSIQLQLTS